MEELNMQPEGAVEMTEQETAEVTEQPATAEETSTEVAEEAAETEETSTPDETVSEA